MFTKIRSILINRRTAKLAVVGAAAAVGMLATAGSAQAAGWSYLDLNGNGRTDSAVWDTNGDNIFEYIYVDADENNVWETYVYSTGNWSLVQRLNIGSIMWVYRDTGGNWQYIDSEGNGLYETLGYDTNRDGAPDYLIVDNNRDGRYDGNWITVGSNTGTTWTPYGTAVRTALNIWLAGVNNQLAAVWLR